MAWNPKAIANYFLSLAEGDGIFITPMKIQKLVYYAHGWYLALTGKPLINEQVEAWKFGPVISTLYHEMKDFSDRPITKKFRSARVLPDGTAEWRIPIIGDNSDPDHKVRDVLDRVWKVYGRYTAVQLSNLAHENGSPWDTVYKRYQGKIPKHTDIPTEEIEKYFRSKAKR